MTVEAIQEAIGELKPEDRRYLTHWLNNLDHDDWDREIERDFAPGGPKSHLRDEILKQITEGLDTPIPRQRK